MRTLRAFNALLFKNKMVVHWVPSAGIARDLTSVASKLYAKTLLTSIKIMRILRKMIHFLKTFT